jgi:hypothetical protein
MDTVLETTSVPITTPAPFTAGPDYIGYIDFALTVGQIGEYVVEQLRLADCRAKSAMWAACNAGALIATAKKKLKHGEFEQWVVDHCDISVRTAQAYMRLAKHVQELPQEEAQRVALLPVREAMKAISAPIDKDSCESGDDHRHDNGVDAQEDDDDADELGFLLGPNINEKLIDIAMDLRLAARKRWMSRETLTKLKKRVRATLAALDEIKTGEAEESDAS